LLLPSIALFALLAVYFNNDRLPSKPILAGAQLRLLHNESDTFKKLLLKAPELNNASFVLTVNPEGSGWKYNNKGELLDPWGQPYVISQNNGQIVITSPGLDQYNKLSWFQKWWSN